MCVSHLYRYRRTTSSPGQGHKIACYGFDSSGMFLPDQTTAPIPPPLFAGRVFRYRQAADRYRQRQFRCPGRFFRGILLQNFRGSIRQIPDPPVWRGCPALPQAPAGRMQVVHRLPEYDRRKTYRIFREKNLCSLRVFASEPENVRFPCERSRYELFDGGFLSCVQGCGKRFPVGCPLLVYDIQIFHVRPPVRKFVFGIQGLRELRSNEAIRSHRIIVYRADCQEAIDYRVIPVRR